VIDRRGTKTVHKCHASAQAGCGLKSITLRSSLSAITCAALQDNRAAGRNIVDRRLRRGGSGHEEIIRCADAIVSRGECNETRSLSLMSRLRVNSGTGGLLAGNRALLDLPRCLKPRPSF
jgi:hypothetical protein